MIVGFKLRRGDVVQNKALPDRGDRDLLLLCEVPFRIEALQQAEVEELGLLLRQGDTAVGRVQRINGHDVQLLMVAERLPIERH